jgi:hypothetical protein
MAVNGEDDKTTGKNTQKKVIIDQPEEIVVDTGSLNNYRMSKPLKGKNSPIHSSDSNLMLIIKVILGIIFWSAVIAIIIILIMFAFRCQKLGGCQWAFEHGSFALKTGVESIDSLSGMSKIWQYITSPETALMNDPSFGEVTSNTDIKISLDSVNTNSPYIFNVLNSNGEVTERNPVENIGSKITVKDINKDTIVSLNCSLKNYKGTVTYELQDTGASSNSFIIPANTQMNTFGVICNFADGVNPTSEDTLVGSRTGTMGAQFDSNAESTWKPYILNSVSYKKMLAAKKNPADYVAKNPNSDLSNNVQGMKTEHSYESSETISFVSTDSMPFQEGKNYAFYIHLKNNDAYSGGNIVSLKFLKLYVPYSVTLATDLSSCDFEDSGTDADGSRIYSLKKQRLDSLRNACSPAALEQGLISKEQCKQDYLQDIKYYCRMSFDIQDLRDTPTFLEFKANAEYNYELSRNFILDFKKNIAPSAT